MWQYRRKSSFFNTQFVNSIYKLISNTVIQQNKMYVVCYIISISNSLIYIQFYIGRKKSEFLIRVSDQIRILVGKLQVCRYECTLPHPNSGSTPAHIYIYISWYQADYSY